jgi:hypothetical protein
MLRLLPLTVVFSAVAALPLAAEEQPAVRIAAELIHQRAAEQAATGHGPVAGQLDALANALSAGKVSLADAALVVQIALAGPAAPTARATALPPAPRVSPAQVAAILDGTAPPPAPGSAKPADLGRAADAAKPDTAKPDDAAKSGDAVKPGDKPADAATADAAKPADAAAPGGPLTTVLAVGRGGDGKTTLVMIAAGTDKHLAKGQRLQVRRGDQDIALLSISDVRDTMAVCVELPIKGPVDAEIREGDAVYPAE